MTEEQEIYDILEKIFENINSWLNYAEVKNGVLVAIIIAWLAYLSEYEGEKILIVMLISFISLILVSISFIPQIQSVFPFWKAKRKEVTKINYIFYGHIAQYDAYQDFMKDILYAYFGLHSSSQVITKYKYASNLSEEIVINSKITYNKYCLFKLAIYPMILSILLFFIFYATNCISKIG